MFASLRYMFLGVGVLVTVAHLASFFVLTEFFEDPLRYMGLALVLWFTVPLYQVE